jgi:hypothetical protein
MIFFNYCFLKILFYLKYFILTMYLCLNRTQLKYLDDASIFIISIDPTKIYNLDKI